MNMLLSLTVALCALAAVAASPVRAAEAAMTQNMRSELHRKAREGLATMKSGDHLRKKTLSYSTTGFVYGNIAFDNQCHTPLSTVGFPVNQCSQSDGFAFKVQIADGVDSCDGAVIQYFSDIHCTNFLGTSAMSDGNLSCEKSGAIFGSQTTYVEFFCTNYGTPKLSFDSSVAEQYTNSTDCAADHYDGFVAFTTDICLQGVDFSWKVRCSDDGEVSWDMYMSSLTCQDDMFNYPFPTTCSLEAPSFDDDDAEADDVDRHILNPPPSVSTTAFPSSVAQMMANGSSLAYCAIANAPSARPTTAPTRFPTASTESTVSFTAAQTIVGFSLDAFNADVELYTLTIKQSVAATMQDVPVESITDLVVTAAAARLVPATVLSVQRAMTTDSVDITYTVTVTSALTVEALMEQLTSAVEDGTFTDLLQAQALTNGATALTTATSDSVTTTAASDDDDAPVLDTGAVVGIAIGGFVFLVLVAVGIYFLCSGSKRSSVAAA